MPNYGETRHRLQFNVLHSLFAIRWLVYSAMCKISNVKDHESCNKIYVNYQYLWLQAVHKLLISININRDDTYIHVNINICTEILFFVWHYVIRYTTYLTKFMAKYFINTNAFLNKLTSHVVILQLSYVLKPTQPSVDPQQRQMEKVSTIVEARRCWSYNLAIFCNYVNKTILTK